MKVIRFWEDTTHPITGCKYKKTQDDVAILQKSKSTVKRNYELHAEYSDMFLT